MGILSLLGSGPFVIKWADNVRLGGLVRGIDGDTRSVQMAQKYVICMS